MYCMSYTVAKETLSLCAWIWEKYGFRSAIPKVHYSKVLLFQTYAILTLALTLKT